MSEEITSKLTLKENKSTGISNESHDSNVSGLGFNIVFIALRNPVLAVKIMELYKAATSILPDDPKAPDEDYQLALEKLSEVMNAKS